MKRKLSLLIAGTLLLSCSNSKNVIDLGYEDYSEGNFLLEIGANSTVRASETTLDIISPSKAVYTVKKAVTIYDKEDKDLSTVVLDYGDFKSINYMKANIINKRGEVVRSYSLTDAEDYSTAWGSTFFSDVRVKVLELPYSVFPYTVEYEYQQTYSGLLNLPRWRPQITGQSVESSTFNLIDRGNTGVRYFARNLDDEPEISNEFGVQKYTWKVDMLMPVKRERMGPPSSEILPQVLVAPGKFEMETSVGDASSWKDFGKWYYELGKDTRELPAEAKAEVDELISGVDSEEEKVRILFDYLQAKSRYVSIQLGIGGWKPFSAEYVYNNSYGDCKALTNYMQAVLDYVGIKAEGVLIYRGINQGIMNVDFPSNQFNHIILRVTLSNGEIIWLECTSKYYPPNHIGPDNEGKNALLITSEGGEVIQTPKRAYTENATDRVWRFKVLEDGAAEMEATVKETGISQDLLLRAVLPVSEKERLDWLHESLEADNSKITDYNFSKLSEIDDFALYEFTAELLDYVRSSSKRLYIPVNKMNRWRFSVPENEEREYPLHLGYSFMESDSVVFETPVGYEIEASPSNVEIAHHFGEFRASFIMNGNKEITYKRYFALKENTIEPQDYSVLKEFFDQVKYADQQQLVLVKKEEG